MAGKVRELIEKLEQKRTKGNPNLLHFVRAQLLLKGIDPARYNKDSEDNPEVLAKLDAMLRDFN
jgi:hypothetical protein